MATKPSKMKKTGKAVASPRSKAAQAASKLGTGAASYGASAIQKNKAAKKKALKSIG